jgi:hypothetical protein
MKRRTARKGSRRDLYNHLKATHPEALRGRYVPDLEEHRKHDSTVMAAVRARHCEKRDHAFIGGIVGGLVETWCSICGIAKFRSEPVQWILEHPDTGTWAVCDRRAINQWTPLVLAGPFETFEQLQAGVVYYRETAADVVTVHIADAETWTKLCDPLEGPRLLMNTLGMVEAIEAEVSW